MIIKMTLKHGLIVPDLKLFHIFAKSELVHQLKEWLKGLMS